MNAPAFHLNIALLRDLAQIAVKKYIDYPPTDIIKRSPEHFEIQMALSGYRQEDIKVTYDSSGHGNNGRLKIEGCVPKSEDAPNIVYIQRNIARRSFTSEIILDRFVTVSKAEMKDGLLTITLKAIIPDECKPQVIPING